MFQTVYLREILDKFIWKKANSPHESKKELYFWYDPFSSPFKFTSWVYHEIDSF